MAFIEIYAHYIAAKATYYCVSKISAGKWVQRRDSCTLLPCVRTIRVDHLHKRIYVNVRRNILSIESIQQLRRIVYDLPSNGVVEPTSARFFTVRHLHLVLSRYHTNSTPLAPFVSLPQNRDPCVCAVNTILNQHNGAKVLSDRKLICPAEELLPLSSEGTLIALAGRRHRPMASARSSATLPARYSSSAFAPRGLD